MFNVTGYMKSLGPLGINPEQPYPLAGRMGRMIGTLGLDDDDARSGFIDHGLANCFLGTRGLQQATTPAALVAAPEDAETLKSELVRICNEEWARWNVPRSGGKGISTFKERSKHMLAVLQDYWQTGVNLAFTFDQLKGAAWQDDHPWSAAFISWVMRKAGGGDRFKYGQRHAIYIHWAKQNRVEENDSWFWLYRLNECVPDVGDLVCKARAGSGATYDNINPNMKTHTDYVVEVTDKYLVTIGGNVADSVTKTIVKIDKDGHITQKGYFAVIRIEE